MDKILVIAILLFSCPVAFAQEKPALKELELSPEQKARFFGGVPVVYGKKNDGFPKRVKVQGVVEDIGAGLLQLQCGIVSYSATVKIRLTRKIKGFNADHIIVLMSCPTNRLKIGQSIKLTAEKIFGPPEKDKGITNSFDMTTPLYIEAKSTKWKL